MGNNVIYEEFTGEERTYKIYIQYLIKSICLKNGREKLSILKIKEKLD